MSTPTASSSNMEPKLRSLFTTRCINPFEKIRHSNVKNGLRCVTPWMCSLVPGMPKNSKICTSCRKDISKLKTNQMPDDSRFKKFDCYLENQSDRHFEEKGDDSPINKRNGKCEKYSNQRSKKFKAAKAKKKPLSSTDDSAEWVGRLRRKPNKKSKKPK